MMWFFNCSKIANGCNISFNCHFIISYVARFWNHHERRLLKVHRSITFSIYLLLIQTLFETNSSFNLYKVLLYTYGWLDGACLGQKEISNGGWRGGGLHWDLPEQQQHERVDPRMISPDDRRNHPTMRTNLTQLHQRSTKIFKNFTTHIYRYYLWHWRSNLKKFCRLCK